jgi:NTP pyrophosphatase (non-canonical NTP hydrolase)
MKWFQEYVSAWAEETFPEATRESVAHHLAEEVTELHDAALAGEREALPGEAADCLLLLLHLAEQEGFDLLDAARTKHDINRRREWGEPDVSGVSHHLGDDCS